jgi:acetylornithine/succinyldiaminopimelate/putrescine aminotransferase
MDSEDLLGHVNALAPGFHEKLRALAAETPTVVSEVRGLGFLIGLKLAVEPGPVVAALREAGLLVVPAGGNVIRLLPALTATAADLEAALAILRQVLLNWRSHP